MSAVDFRHIAFDRGPRNCERVFRAAISAYCTLERPTRHETAQLDDLALGLFDAVSVEARRFAAAALSECETAPPGLVRRLVEEPLEIAAPLLVRSRVLSDVDLIALIGHCGIDHAKVIARREDLNPVIAALIRALVARAETVGEEAPAGETPRQESAALAEVRSRLLDLMKRREPDEPPRFSWPLSAGNLYPALRDAALSGNASRLAAMLGESLGLSPKRAESLVIDSGLSDLLVALRALDLAPEQAFLVAAAVAPSHFMHAADARLFLARYDALTHEAACHRIETWQGEAGARPPATLHSLASGR